MEWTAATIRRFREVGLCLPRDKFAKELGFAKRTVGNAESGANSPSLALRRALDQALEKATDAQRDRFLAHSLTTGPIVAPQQVYGQSNVLLPVVIDGRQVLLPLDAAAVAGRGLALAMNLAPSIGDPARLEAKPVTVERAYELYLRGQGLLATNDKKRIDAATTLLDSALGIDPRFARAQAARGYAHWRRYFSGWESGLSTLERALGDVDVALRLDPDSIGARATLIRICWDMGWHERALEIGRAIYEKNPDSLDATLAFARALNNAGMAEAALPLTRAVLQVDPTNPTAAKLLIWNHLMVSDYSSALEAACLYLPAHPQDSNTRWAVALAHLGNEDIDAAIGTVRDAVAADPDDIAIWNLFGYLHRLSGEESAAQHAWSTGLEHAAAHAEAGTCRNLRAQSWLANIEACVGHTDRAQVTVTRLTAAEPHNGYLKYRLAHVLAELGDTEEAIRILSEAVQDGFLSIQLLWHDERLGVSSLVNLTGYHQVGRVLRQNVDRVKNKYAPSVVSSGVRPEPSAIPVADRNEGGR
ncbi:MAG: tetratricopeptide repeat protein [Pseudonocardiaceae bacterium]